MRSAVTVLLLFALAAIAPAARAQYPGGRPTGAGAHGEHPPSVIRDHPTDVASLGGPVLVQLDQLENELKLTPEQRPAWNAFGDQVLHLADDMTRSQFVARTAPRPTDATAHSSSKRWPRRSATA